MIRNTGFVLVGIGLIISIVCKAYNGTFILSSILVFYFGLVLVSIGALIIRSTKTKKEQFIENEFIKLVNSLKSNGTKLEISFKDCDIISNKYYYDTHSSKNAKVQVYDSFRTDGKQMKTIEVNHSRVVFKNEVAEYFSQSISKDKETLAFLLANKEKTSLYIDKSDPTFYYMDLEFLTD